MVRLGDSNCRNKPLNSIFFAIFEISGAPKMAPSCDVLFELQSSKIPDYRAVALAIASYNIVDSNVKRMLGLAARGSKPDSGRADMALPHAL